jgi:uncharacterized membrane protein YbhN (UPF0104 family)
VSGTKAGRKSTEGKVRFSFTRPSTTAASWIGIVIAVVFAYFAVRNVRFADVWHGLRTSNYWLLLPAFAMLAVAVFLKVCAGATCSRGRRGRRPIRWSAR